MKFYEQKKEDPYQVYLTSKLPYSQKQQSYKNHNNFSKKYLNDKSYQHYRKDEETTDRSYFNENYIKSYPLFNQYSTFKKEVPSGLISNNFNQNYLQNLNLNTYNTNQVSSSLNNSSLKNPKPYLGDDWKFQPKKQYDLIKEQQLKESLKNTKITTIHKQQPLIQTVSHPNWNEFYQKQHQQLEPPPLVPNKVQRKQSCNNAIWALIGVLCIGALVAGLILFLNHKNQQVKIKQASAIDAQLIPEKAIINSTKNQNNQINNKNQPFTNISKTIQPQVIKQQIIQPLVTQPLLFTSQVNPVLIKPELKTKEQQQIIGSKIVYFTNSQYNKMNQNTYISPVPDSGYESQPLYVAATPKAFSSSKISYQIPIQTHLQKKNHFFLRKFEQ